MKHINKIEEKKVAVCVRLRAKRKKTDSREEIIFIATVELVEATYTHALTPPNAFSSAAGEWKKSKNIASCAARAYPHNISRHQHTTCVEDVLVRP